MPAHRSRPRVVKFLAIATLTASMALTGGLMSSASAAGSKHYSKNYWSKADCLRAQKAYSGSFTRISQSCHVVRRSGLVLDATQWRFKYTSRY